MSAQYMTADAYRALIKQPGKRHKYNAKRVSGDTRDDGKSFDTKLEANRYDTLRIMERTGAIVAGSIRTQVPYRLDVNGRHVCIYKADFVYRLVSAPDVDVVEDAKGVSTDKYKLKKKLMAACLGIEIQEVGKERKGKNRPRFSRKKKN